MLFERDAASREPNGLGAGSLEGPQCWSGAVFSLNLSKALLYNSTPNGAVHLCDSMVGGEVTSVSITTKLLEEEWLWYYSSVSCIQYV